MYKPSPTAKIEVPQLLPFFVEPPLEEKEGEGGSPFIIITAPGATGKSAFGSYLSHEKNLYYWNLAGANIGDNYFIGHLNAAFGTKNIPQVLQDIQCGKIGFVIDAFDEAEVSCGLDKILTFVEEINSFMDRVSVPSIVLIARPETAEYIAIHLECLLKGQKYKYYKIGFFTQEKAKEFLEKYLKNISRENAPHKDRILQVFEFIANRVDEVLNQGKEKDEFQFYGYVPVIQAIAELFKEENNFQRLETEYKTNTDFSRHLITKIVDDILKREQEKFITNFLGSVIVDKNVYNDIEKVYSQDQQIYYLVCVASGEKPDFASEINYLNLPQNVIRDYPDAAGRFFENHPFRSDEKGFVSMVFRDYCCASLLVKHSDNALNLIQKNLTNITPLFYDFYLGFRKENGIEGEYVGILLESLLSLTKTLTGDTRSAIYSSDGGHFLSYALAHDSEKKEKEVKMPIIGQKLIFFNRLRDIFIDVSCDIELLCTTGESFALDRTEIRTSGGLDIKASRLDVVCNNNDDEVLLFSEVPFEYPQNLHIGFPGSCNLFTVCFPGGKKYPFADYYKEMDKFEIKTDSNAFQSLRSILSWFRKDGRDAIARNIFLIDNIVRGSKIKTAMLHYLLEKHILFKSDVFYKIALKEAGRKGINFSELRKSTPKEELITFLQEFIRRYDGN
jgi:hypothetical protein